VSGCASSVTDKLKTVAVFATPTEADLAKNCLAAAGLQAFLADELTVGWLWHLGTALGGIKLMVAESDLPRARQLLSGTTIAPLIQHRRQAGEDGGETRLPSAWQCPKCRAEVPAELDACWACGTSPDGVEDPHFQDTRLSDSTARQTDTDEAPSPTVGTVLLFLLAAAPMLAMLVAVSANAMPRDGVAVALVWFSCAAFFVIVVAVGVALRRASSFPSPTEAADQAVDGVDATRVQSGAAADSDADSDQQWDSDTVSLQATARRAYLTSVWGVAFCPPLLNVYSLWLISTHGLLRNTVRGKTRTLVWCALVLNIVVCVAVFSILLLADGLSLRP
jgi:hypothetical protein